MDSMIKQLRVRFSGVGQEEEGGSQAIAIPRQNSTSFGRGPMSNGEEYDAAFAATIAAAAYAVAAREEKLQARKETTTAPVYEPSGGAPSPKSPIRRRESMKRPTGGSKISRWLSGKEPAEDGDDDNVPGANVSVRRPLIPAQIKPQDTTSDWRVQQKVIDFAPSMKREPSFSTKQPEKKGSKRFEQDEASQNAPPATGRPDSSYSARGRGAGTAEAAASSEAEMMAASWEKAKLAKVRERYDKTMETIAEWETEKKAKTKRRMEQKESDLNDRQRAKALQQYNEEIARINKVAGEARSMAEERRRNDENGIKKKANKIRSTGKLPRSCGCF